MNPAPKSHFHVSESKAIDNAAVAIEIWYQYMLSRGRAKFTPKTKKRQVPDVPDEYLRPESFIGPSASRPDGTTAWGVETKPSGKSGFPYGVGSSLEVVSRDEREWMRRNQFVRGEALRITVSAMRTLGTISIHLRLSTEMRCAGYSTRSIAKAFSTEDNRVTKEAVTEWWRCSLTWVAGCLIIKPDFSAALVKRPRNRMLASDLGI